MRFSLSWRKGDPARGLPLNRVLIQQVRTARPAFPEPPKIRPLAFCTLRIDFICALCCLSAFTHYGFILMSQKNPETESVRDQQ